MSLDECVGDMEREQKSKQEPKRKCGFLAVFDALSSPNQWIFRFRGRNRGQTGGAVVVVQIDMNEPRLVAGVSICTPLDRWNPDKGIEIAVARIHSQGTDRRPNPWRFTTVLSPTETNPEGRDVYTDPEHKTIYAFARECLYWTFISHNFSEETNDWFFERFPWLLTKYGLNFTGNVTSG